MSEQATCFFCDRAVKAGVDESGFDEYGNLMCVWCAAEHGIEELTAEAVE